MNGRLIEAAETLNNEFVRRWKEDGGRVVGYTCSYAPDEVFHAAGILPYRIRGYGAQETTIGDTYFGPFICSLPKCMLQLAGGGAFDFLDGVVIVPGCDSMRRLDDCWRKAGQDIAGVVPPFFFHFAVPHKFADYTVNWFEGEIRRLIEAVERHFDVRITVEGLRVAIAAYNRGRALLEELERMRRLPEPPIAGAEALSVVIAGAAMPRDAYNDLLEECILDLRAETRCLRGRRRLMLVGSASDDTALVRFLEGDRALVVADNLCFGARFHNDRVDDGVLDPVRALAERYLRRSDCPRMYGDYRRRLEILTDAIQSASVEGVILQNIRFCDLHGAENGLFERDLEARGIPCMRIEREYGPLVETGRLKMRLDAFLERIDGKRRTA